MTILAKIKLPTFEATFEGVEGSSLIKIKFDHIFQGETKARMPQTWRMVSVEEAMRDLGTFVVAGGKLI